MYFVYMVNLYKKKNPFLFKLQCEFRDSLHQGQAFSYTLNFSQISPCFANKSDF